MSMYGNDYDYANSRLEGTVVRLKCKPVYVHNVTRGMKAIVSYLSKMDDYFVVEAEELDLKPVPLGYCNKRGYATYLMRMPMRRDWRQGTRLANMTTKGELPIGLFNNRDLEDVVLNNYPTLKECLKAISKGTCRSMAWCREWAIGLGNVLLYKTEPVGTVVDGVPVLDEANSYLSQSLGEVL